MTETGCRNGRIMSGYGSGAEGPMQFMPGTWSIYGVDGDGDNKADIDDATDAIYSAANYLAKHGSIMAGLQSYGGNTSGTLALARSKGTTSLRFTSELRSASSGWLYHISPGEAQLQFERRRELHRHYFATASQHRHYFAPIYIRASYCAIIARSFVVTKKCLFMRVRRTCR